MSIFDSVKGWFTSRDGQEDTTKSPASKYDSGPVPSGPLTVSLASYVREPRQIADLDLWLNPGETTDLGFFYTQKQINDSNALKHYIDAGTVVYTQTGTIPSAEPVEVSVGPVSVDIDQASDSILIYGNDGGSNQKIKTDSTGIVQVNPTGLAGGATEATQLAILEELGGGTAVNKNSIFGSYDITDSAETSIVEYEVPSGFRFRIDGVRGWSDIDAEYAVYIGSTQIDGGRTTPSNLTMSIESMSVQHAEALELISVKATHFHIGKTKTFKAVIQGALEVTP